MANQKPKSCPFNPYKHKGHFARHLVTTIILVIITFLAGLYLAGTGAFSPFGQVSIAPGAEQPAKKAVKKGSYEQGYQEALDFARQRLTEEGMIEGFEGPLTFLRATVKSVSGQNVVIEFKASELDLFQEGMATKTVVVPADLFIEQQADKPEEQIAKEYEAFEKAYQEYEASLAENPELEEEGPEEPMTYTVVNLSAGDLKAGDVLTIRTDSDIRTNDSFEASFIRLASRLVEEPTEEELPEELPEEESAEEPVLEAAPEELAEDTVDEPVDEPVEEVMP